ncbi:MAG: DUF1553 domain-containing protein [Verrucomicrobia bacterium]|nr:DUF1553 domain-containing protein [Verrucomicrobiota bacterium]
MPQQALYMMNSDWVTGLAREMVNRTDFKKELDEEQRIAALYQIAFQRPPTEIELKLGKRFLEVQSGIKSGPANVPVWRYGYGQYDAAGKKLANYFPLSVFDGKAWNAEPAKQLGGIRLDATGGRTSSKLGIAVIRRWTAPRDVTVSIDGSLAHASMARGMNSEGVHAYIVSSRGGELGRYNVANKTADTKIAKLDLKKGDTIDFVANRGVKGNANGETFTWAPIVKVAGAAPMMMGSMASMNPAEANEWRAAADFGSAGKGAPQKPFGTWEKYAQVLLLSNEMAFLD